MIQFVMQHQFGTAAVIYWIVSAAISALPEPDGKSNAGYVWLYRFSHTVAGNLTTAFGNRLSTIAGSIKSPVTNILLVTLLAGSVFGCSMPYTMHPGALNTTDSAAYDALLIAKTAIDQAKAKEQAGLLPDSDKPALAALIKSYNAARASWLIYPGALSSNTPSDQYSQQLSQNLAELITAIQSFGKR